MLAVLGVCVGVAAVVAVTAARQTVEQSFQRGLQALQGSATHSLVSTGDEISMAQYAELRRTFPVWPMAPVIRERARLLHSSGQDSSVVNRVTVLGLDVISEMTFTTERESDGGLLADADGIDMSAWLDGQPLALIAPAFNQITAGQKLRIVWRGQERTLSVSGRLNPASSLGDDVIVVDLALASAWFDRGGIDSVRMQLTDDQANLLMAKLPAGLQLQGADDQSGLGAAFSLNLVAMGLLALLMGVLMVFSTFRLLLLQREPLMRLQHALGSSPLSQAGDALTEAILVGLLGTALGLLAGLGLAELVISWIRQTLSDLWVTGFNGNVSLTGSMLFQGLLAGLGGSLLAVTPLLWRVYKTGYRITDTAAGKRYGPVALAILLLLSASGLLFGSDRLVLALAGLFAATMGYLLLSVPLLGILSKWVRYGIGWRRLLSVLAARRLQASLGHTGPALVALILAVASIIGIGSMVNSFRGSVTDWLDVSLSASAYIGADGQALPETLRNQVADWPQVGAVSWLNTVDIQLSGEHAQLSIIELPPAGQNSYRMLDGQSLWQIHDQPGTAVMVGETLAARRKIKTGQLVDFVIDERDIRVTAQVSGIFQDYRAGPGRMVILRGAMTEPPAVPTALGVYLHGENQFEQLRRQLDELSWLPVEVEAISSARVKAETLRIFDQTFLLTRSLRWIVALVALVGITGALLALQLERQAELQLLQRLGLSGREQRRLLLYEAILLGGLAVLLAFPLGAMLTWLLCEVINQRAFGWHITARFLPQHYLLAALVGMLATVTAGWLCLRGPGSGEQPRHSAWRLSI